MTAWEDVDGETKTNMEGLWTKVLLRELRKLPKARDEKEAKEIASSAKSKATTEVKRLYMKRYKIKDD